MKKNKNSRLVIAAAFIVFSICVMPCLSGSSSAGTAQEQNVSEKKTPAGSLTYSQGLTPMYRFEKLPFEEVENLKILDQMARDIQRIYDGDLSGTVDLKTYDEIKKLAAKLPGSEGKKEKKKK